VVTWKSTPEEQQQEALKKGSKERPYTNITHDGKKKAKCRIALLGCQHPDLLTIKNSSSVRSHAAKSRMDGFWRPAMP